jgi:hypothetical protein
MTTGASERLGKDIFNDDICHAITQVIFIDHGIRTLIEFSSACKRFRRAALPTIFETVRIRAPADPALWDSKLERFEAFSSHSGEAVGCVK